MLLTRDVVKMILLWMTFLVLHQTYSLAPVISVQLGEPVTFTCAQPNGELKPRWLSWYKQSAGDVLKLIVMQETSTEPKFTPEFPETRFKLVNNKKFINLTIVKTTEEDEGMYLCEVSEWVGHPLWTGTYLLLKENIQKTSNYTVIQSLTGSDPGDSVTLQCSIFSDHKNKTCPGHHGVYWFRAGSDKSHPDLIYTEGNECEKGSDSLKSCVYRLFKSVSSSDAGIYHCAVATCGEIIFGNGTKLLVSDTGVYPEFIALMIAVVCLIISVSVNIIFIYHRTSRAEIESVSSQGRRDDSSTPAHDLTEGRHDLNYAVLPVSGRKVTRGQKTTERNDESIYSQVRR